MKLDLLTFLKNHPIRGIKIYPNGSVEITRSFEGKVRVDEFVSRETNLTRGLIKNWSRSSRNRLAWVADRTMGIWKSMITLTYGDIFPETRAQVKTHLNAMLTWIRRKMQGVRYLWFMEFQKRGATHFHILIDRPVDHDLAPLLAHTWCLKNSHVDGQQMKVYNHHMYPCETGYNIWQNARSIGGLSRYAVKYAFKMNQKALPEYASGMGRFWGNSRGLIKDDGYYVPMSGETLRFIIDEYGNRSLRNMEVPPKYIIGLLPEDVSEWLTLDD